MYLYGIEIVDDSAIVGVVIVLIVPLWNWNRGWAGVKPSEKDVLIVPLWNWN